MSCRAVMAACASLASVPTTEARHGPWSSICDTARRHENAEPGPSEEPDSRHGFDVIIVVCAASLCLSSLQAWRLPHGPRIRHLRPFRHRCHQAGRRFGPHSEGLRVAESNEKVTADGLRLNFSIQVYGQSPRIEVLKGVDLFNGGVPGTAPSHNQMIEFWTPAIYRTPGLPISALAFWAAQQFWEKSKKSRCEEEIANYRALIMQGVNVAAPRCTQ